MARRPSIQLNDLQNSSQQSIEQKSSIFQLRHSTQNIKQSFKRRHNFGKPSTSLIQDSCIIKNEEGYFQQKQKILDYLNVSKIDQLRYRIASAQKTKLQQNKQILKTVSIPLSLQKKPPMIRIHQQVLVKNCQKIQLQNKHFLNQIKKEENGKMKVNLQRTLTVCGSTNNKDTQQCKKQNKVNHHPNVQKNIRSHSQPYKIIQNELTEENQFLPKRKKTKKDMNFKIQFKNKGFETKIKLKMIKFEPFALRQCKNTLNGYNSQSQAEIRQSKLFQNIQKQPIKKSNLQSNKHNKHGLSLQLLQLYNKIKNSPSKTPQYQLALFKNKLQGKGNHRLIL